LKKLKGFENQLEDAHEERLSFIREKRELESKIITLQDLVTKSTDEEQVTLKSLESNCFMIKIESFLQGDKIET